jgi:mRNA-degrading endonuclease toxin of MazEF toxin-antitoxin module
MSSYPEQWWSVATRLKSNDFLLRRSVVVVSPFKREKLSGVVLVPIVRTINKKRLKMCWLE